MTAVESPPTGTGTGTGSPGRTATVLDLTTSGATANVARARRTGRQGRRTATILLPAVIGITAVWFILFAFVLTGFQEQTAQGRLYDQYRLQLAEETAPLAEPVKVGSPVAMISAPEAGLHDVIVVEGTTSRLLRSGPGHLSDSPLPGQVGDSVLLGRSVTYGGPFGRIGDMRPGDRLTITDGEGIFQYRVEDVRHPGDRLPAPLTADQSRITLVTAGGGGWREGWAPTQTLYVDALLAKGQPQGVPAGVPAAVGKTSQPMQGDPGGLVPLIFWIEGLVAAAVLVRWSWLRWGHPQTWVTGAPIILFALWGTSDALMRFLPNLL